MIELTIKKLNLSNLLHGNNILFDISLKKISEIILHNTEYVEFLFKLLDKIVNKRVHLKIVNLYQLNLHLLIKLRHYEKATKFETISHQF